MSVPNSPSRPALGEGDSKQPFDPERRSLYTPRELFKGLAKNDPDSYAGCVDIQILSYFKRNGTNPVQDPRASTLEALHDNSISEAARRLLQSSEKVVAIMGGHGMVRGTNAFRNIARLAHRLARSGFLIASGGGPGAMEASHLGAFMSKKSESTLESAFERLREPAGLPADVSRLVDLKGNVNPSIARALHKWLEPALSIVERLPSSSRGRSLGIPTWLYGYEPTTPFATLIAKYFQNSLREDGLVTLGTSGIVYAEGSAGTVQEIFQDVAQNFYGAFCPMVFLSSPRVSYWERILPVRPLIEALLGQKSDFSNVFFTDSWQDATTFFINAAKSVRVGN